MIKKISAITMILLLFSGCSNTQKIPETVELKTWQDSVSYSLGADLSNTFNIRGIEYETDSFIKGFFETIKTDSSYAYGASIAANFILRGVEIDPLILLNAFEKNNNSDSLLLSNPEMKEVMSKFDQEMRDAMVKQRQTKLDKTKLSGEAYIEKYKNEHDDEIETESGLVYRVIKEGFGDIPTLDDKVIVHYIGRLTDGTVFDSSFDKGEPATFRVTGVIQGWQEALTLMRVGSKWELVVPSILGYGERTMGNIPGMSTLIFEVELLEIE